MSGKELRSGLADGNAATGGRRTARFATPIYGLNWTSWLGSTRRIGSGPKVTPVMRTTTGATGLPRMPPGRRPVPGPTAGRMAAFVLTWAAIMFLRIRRPVCSTLSILGMTLKMRATQASLGLAEVYCEGPKQEYK